MSERQSEQLFTGYTGRLSLVLAIGVLATNLGRQALPPLLPAIIEGFSISEGQAGFSLTVLWGAYALSQYPAGRFADDLSRKTGLVIGLGIMVVGFLILTTVRDYHALLWSAALIGFGAAYYILAARTLLSDLFVDRRGESFGLNIAMGQFGSILAAGLAVAALSIATWQSSFLPVIVLLLIVLASIHVQSREPYRFHRFPLRVHRTINRVFGTSQLRRLVIAYTLVIFTWQGVIGFLPTYLAVEKGFSTVIASSGFALVYAIGMIVQPMAGRLSDRTNRLSIAIGTALVCAIGLTALLFVSSSLLIVLAIVVFATGLMGFSPVTQAYLMDVFPEDSKGGDLGAFKTIYEGLGSLGPTYVGLLAATTGYGVAFGGLVACLLLSAAVIYSTGT